jgi:ribosomal protein L12E/L44/L45/RPP1/RPP2
LEEAWKDKVTFQVTYGFTLGEDGKLTEEQLEELKKKAGIETQRIELSAYIKKLELGEDVKGLTIKEG